MRTTLTLDDDVVLGIKRIQQRRPEASFKEVVNQLMKKGLAAEGEGVVAEFKVRPLVHSKPRAGTNFDNVWKLISEVEGDFHK